MLLNLPILLSSPSTNDLFTLLFLVAGILLAAIWQNFILVFIHKVRALLLSSDWRSFEVENATSGVRLRLVLMFVYLLSLSVSSFHLNNYLEARYIPFYIFPLLLFLAHLAKISMSALISYVFSCRNEFAIWVESYMWIHYIVGVVSLPLAVFLTYSPFETISFCAYFGLGVLFLAELLLIYRVAVIFNRGIVSFFYLFLYLCTLELIPLLTICRLLS